MPNNSDDDFDLSQARPAKNIAHLVALRSASKDAAVRGRPKADVTKERLTIRVDPAVLARWRASGPGWQTRAAAVLASAAP
jgi:uncharacterized protein (DUF4415 family)